MQELIDGLDGVDWLVSAKKLHNLLKPKFQTKDGVIRAVKDIYEKERKEALKRNKEIFLQDKSIENLDERINNFTNEILRINTIQEEKISFELLNTIDEKREFRIAHPECFEVSKMLIGSNLNNKVKTRLTSVVHGIIFQSLDSARKSNAGVAGEDFNKIIFDVSGLRQGKDYKRQHKSKEGSDTDFVFPYVENYDDLNVEIFMEVQFSTNDRIRLADSGLKTGGNMYFVTGNGLDACALTMEKIGTQNIEKCKKKNIQLVCYAPEIDREIIRLKNKVQDGVNPEENSMKLEYIKSAINFSELAKRLKRRRID